MAEGEHTIISKIPRERLNQIAGRKLAALGIPVRLAPDRETLEGDLAFGTRVVNPVGGARIARARFQVTGHDHLRFLDPPLSALPPMLYYDVERTGELEARVTELLARRASLLHDVAARLRALKLEPTLDPDRLVARAVVKTTTKAFELLGGPEGVRVARVAPVGGKPFEVPAGFPLVRLDEHPSLTDLELWLDGRSAEMQGPSRAPGEALPAAAARTGRLEPVAPPRNAVTLRQITDALGPDAAVAPTSAIEVFQDFQCDGTRYRFVATRDVGTTFKGRLIGPSGDVWSDSFDVTRFPGTLALVAGALGVTSGDDLGAAAGAAAQEAPPDIPEHLLPRSGEVWVMSVVVESAGEEVRYVVTDIDGRPYGAARVLKKAEFEAVFSRERNGWRLLVLVDRVQAGNVLYRQLDALRHPVGAPRRMPVSVMVANFVPEAAAF